MGLRSKRWLSPRFPEPQGPLVSSYSIEPQDGLLGAPLGWYPVFSGQRIESLAVSPVPVTARSTPSSRLRQQLDLAKQIRVTQQIQHDAMQAQQAASDRSKQIQAYQQWQHNTVQAQLAMGDQAFQRPDISTLPPNLLPSPFAEKSGWNRTVAAYPAEPVRRNQVSPHDLLLSSNAG